MTKTIKYLLATFLLLPLFSFSQKVENVHFEQVGKQIYIYYDLQGTDNYDVTIYCSEDNGNTWGNPLQAVSGDVDVGIKPGNNKKVVWDALKEKTKLTGNIKFKIKAESFVLIDPRDRQRYKMVKIGKQIWMAENLNFKIKNSYCYYKPINCKKYGRLYLFNAALKACPKGYHLPSDNEWKQLEMYLGINKIEVNNLGWRGTIEAKKIKSTNRWQNNCKGSNSTGFNALPGGILRLEGALYYHCVNLGKSSSWWSSTEKLDTNVWYRYIYYSKNQIFRGSSDKMSGFSIRCIKD